MLKFSNFKYISFKELEYIFPMKKSSNSNVTSGYISPLELINQFKKIFLSLILSSFFSTLVAVSEKNSTGINNFKSVINSEAFIIHKLISSKYFLKFTLSYRDLPLLRSYT